MTMKRLQGKAVERVWGRHVLPSWAGAEPLSDEPVGEVWFEDEIGPASELLVKYLFTSERLSIQVHPDDAQAHALGLPRGKDEAWLIVDAEPGAVIGLGLTHPVSRDALREAALDGSIEGLVEWRPAKAGDFFYSPAGTIHAIGAGLSLVEIQQNLDLTYRLYDYGRPRELHLDQGAAASTPEPWHWSFETQELEPGRVVLAAGGAFVVERWRFAEPMMLEPADDQLLLIPLAAGGRIGGQMIDVGAVWRVEGTTSLSGNGSLDILAAYPGWEVRRRLCRAAEA